MKTKVLMLGTALAAASAICPPGMADEAIEPDGKVLLFDGQSFDGWVRILQDEKADVDQTWAIQPGGILACSGKPHGYIRTVESYANYKLHVEWRWIDEPTNSGVLLDKAGIDRVWPRGVEAQLMHQNAGDFWLLNFSTIVVDGKKIGPGEFVNAKKKHPSNEKPVGQWNTYDIVCDGGTVQLTVNGLLQNEGTDADPASGPICLQSEGSPIEFRNIYLEPLAK